MSYLDMLRALDEDGVFSRMPESASVESVETPQKPGLDTLDTSTTGAFRKNRTPKGAVSCTPPHTAEADIPEVEARRLPRVYRVLVGMDDGQPKRWVTMLGCTDDDDARRAAINTFGSKRVVEIEVQQ